MKPRPALLRLSSLILAIGFALLAWNGRAGGRLEKATLVVFVLFAALSLASLLAAILPARAGIALILVVASTSLGLALVEAGLRTWSHLAPFALPDTYDRRSVLEVVSMLREQGVDATPTFHPVNHLDPPPKIAGKVTIPFGGISAATVVHCNSNETGCYVTYDSDEYGFNNPLGVWQREPPIDVALVGDSFTQGHCVDLDQQFPTLIRQRYPGTVNLGSDGNGPLIELASLLEYLPPLEPRVVLWCYFEGNDFWNLNREKQTPLLLEYLDGDFTQGLAERQGELDAYFRDILERRLRANAKRPQVSEARVIDRRRSLGDALRLGVTRKLLGRFGRRGPREPEAADLELFARILGQAREAVSSWGGRLYFVYLPEHATVSTGNEHVWRGEVLALVEDLGLPIIDIEAAFRREPDAPSFFPFGKNGHYDDRGAAVVAREVLAAIGGELPSDQ